MVCTALDEACVALATAIGIELPGKLGRATLRRRLAELVAGEGHSRIVEIDVFATFTCGCAVATGLQGYDALTRRSRLRQLRVRLVNVTADQYRVWGGRALREIQLLFDGNSALAGECIPPDFAFANLGYLEAIVRSWYVDFASFHRESLGSTHSGHFVLFPNGNAAPYAPFRHLVRLQDARLGFCDVLAHKHSPLVYPPLAAAIARRVCVCLSKNQFVREYGAAGLISEDFVREMIEVAIDGVGNDCVAQYNPELLDRIVQVLCGNYEGDGNEAVADFVVEGESLSILDPTTLQRLVVPCRTVECRHLRAFELPRGYRLINTCPVCGQRYIYGDCYTDYFIMAVCRAASPGATSARVDLRTLAFSFTGENDEIGQDSWFTTRPTKPRLLCGKTINRLI